MKKRVVYIDLLNVLACICVISMHVNGIVHTFSYDRAWKTSLIVETVAYWAVPVFFMITGAMLLDYTKKYSTKIYMKKRVVKTFIPFIIWSLIFLLLRIHDPLISSTEINAKKLLELIFSTQINNVYWFFPALFTVYLGIPVFAHIKEECRSKILNYVIAYGIIMISIVPCLCILAGIQFNGELRPTICGGYMLLTLIGYQLSKVDLSKKTRVIIYFCGLVGWLMRYISTLLISLKTGEIYKGLWGYFNFPTIMLSVAVFVWFKYHDWSWIENKAWLANGIKTIAGCSFGIYLIHIFFVWKIPGIIGVSTTSWEWRTFGILLVYAASLVVVWLIKKVPGVKWLVP